MVEPLSSKTGLGSKYGFWLAKLGLPKLPIYDHIGINKGGEGGLWEHAYEQGYDSESIQAKVKNLNDQVKALERNQSVGVAESDLVGIAL